MDRVTLSKIAKIHRTSTTTVYHAIYSCTPVNTKLKRDMLNTAVSVGYFLINKMPACDIAVILKSEPL
ncbi:MAG: hypothetical protein GX166_07365 [Clostridiaceae bacterium]|nr:hypothetical protein [Clostridiaceae bacterium]